jgi:hypothetical protein
MLHTHEWEEIGRDETGAILKCPVEKDGCGQFVFVDFRNLTKYDKVKKSGKTPRLRFEEDWTRA